MNTQLFSRRDFLANIVRAGAGFAAGFFLAHRYGHSRMESNNDSNGRPSKRKVDTLGHTILRIENELGVTYRDHATLDGIVEKVRRAMLPRSARLEGSATSAPKDRTDKTIESTHATITQLSKDIELYEDSLKKMNPEDPSYTMIQEFIKTDKRRINIERQRSHSYIFFSSITEVLKEEGYTTTAPGNPDLFNGALKKKSLKCDTASILYVSVAQALQCPIHAVMLPNHVFVRWDADGEHDPFSDSAHENAGDFNWETRNGLVFADHFYLSQRWGSPVKRPLNLERIKRTSYLQTLSHQQATSIGYKNAAMAYFLRSGKRDLEKALQFSTSAIACNPDCGALYGLRALIRTSAGDSTGAASDRERRGDLSPF